MEGRRIERVFRFTTPEAQDVEDFEHRRAMSGDERVALLEELRRQWGGDAFDRLERTHRFVAQTQR